MIGQVSNVSGKFSDVKNKMFLKKSSVKVNGKLPDKKANMSKISCKLSSVNYKVDRPDVKYQESSVKCYLSSVRCPELSVLGLA